MTIFSRKTLVAALIITAMFYSTPGGAAEKKAVKKDDPSKEVIMRVDGAPYNREELNIEVNNLFPLMSFHSSASPERMNQIEKAALYDMINEAVIIKDAKRNGMARVENKEIDAQINDIKKGLPRGMSLAKVLKNSDMTMSNLREYLANRITMRRYKQKKNEELKKKAEQTVTEAYMKSYYEKNLGKFKLPEQVRVQTILIKADPSGGTRVWNAALKKATDLANRARKGEDFGKLAEKYSQDPYANKGGDMGWIHVGSLFEEIDTAVAAMKVGEVSNPIMTIYGYHVVKLDGKKPALQKKFEELNKDKLKKELVAKEYKRLWDGWIIGLRNASKIEYLAKDVKELMNKPTAEAEK